MASRTNKSRWIGAVAQIAGLILLLGLVSPQLRQAIFALGFIAVLIVGLAVIGIIGFSVFRFFIRSRRATASEGNLESNELDVDANSEGNQPQTTNDLIQRLRSIDWFQFEKLVALIYRKVGCTVTHRGGREPRWWN